MSTDQDLTRTEAILAGSGLDRIAIFWKLVEQDWIRFRKFLFFLFHFFNHIKNFSCNPILQIF